MSPPRLQVEPQAPTCTNMSNSNASGKLLYRVAAASAAARRAILAVDGTLKMLVSATDCGWVGCLCSSHFHCNSTSVRECFVQCFCSNYTRPRRCHWHNHDQTHQVSGLSDPNPDRSLWSLAILKLCTTPGDVHLMAQAAARDPTCITAALHTALGARRQLASVTDPERYKELHGKLFIGLAMLHIIILMDEFLQQPLGAALAAAPPATLDALGEWITPPDPSGAEVELEPVRAALTIAACAAVYSPAAAAALARRRSVVRGLVSAVALFSSPSIRHMEDGTTYLIDNSFAMFDAMLRASSADVMLALAAGPRQRQGQR